MGRLDDCKMNHYLLRFMEKSTSLSRDEILEVMKDMVIETYKKAQYC
jgi:hypothetical protein